jgi:hypothetical protein
MSTGAECYFVERAPRKWYYALQEWPYGEWPEYETYGPFSTYKEAQGHLDDNHANPGGWSVEPLPGCEHDLLTKDPWGEGYCCDRCGSGVKEKAASK